jgi:tetratricopeptide (TPR) repeat protein
MKRLSMPTLFQKAVRQTLNSIPAQVLILALLGVLSYSNTLNVPFVFDDFHNIVESGFVHDLENFFSPGKIFGSIEGRRYLGFLSLALNYHFHGTETAGYHVVNVLIHIGSAVMLYLFMLLILSHTGGMDKSAGSGTYRTVALLVGAIFVSHPVQTQAVTYIVQRFSSLAAFLFLGSLVAYAAARRIGQGPRKAAALYIASLVSAFGALITKENAITLPLVLLAYELIFIKQGLRRMVLLVLPFMIIAAIVPVQLIYSASAGQLSMEGLLDATRLDSDMPRWDYLLTQGRVLITYIRLILLPIGQRLVYDYPVYPSISQTIVLISALFHMTLIGSAIALLKYSGSRSTACAAFGVLFFYLTNLVESSVFPIANIVFEHRVYLPSAGIIIALVALGAEFYERIGAGRAYVILPVILIGVLCFASFSRNAVWKSELSVWQDNVSKSPSHQMSRYALADAYYYEKRYKEAIKHYIVSIRLNPNHIESYNNMALSYQGLRQYKNAEAVYISALGVEPDSPMVLVNLANVLDMQDRLDEAMATYQKAIAIEPMLGDAHYNLGLMHFKTKRFAEALGSFKRALELDPGNRDAVYYMGELQRRSTGR